MEKRCAQYYVKEEKLGRPSLSPGVYSRMLMVAHFEGIDSQRNSVATKDWQRRHHGPRA
jgi:hypothetical protein